MTKGSRSFRLAIPLVQFRRSGSGPQVWVRFQGSGSRSTGLSLVPLIGVWLHRSGSGSTYLVPQVWVWFHRSGSGSPCLVLQVWLWLHWSGSTGLDLVPLFWFHRSGLVSLVLVWFYRSGSGSPGQVPWVQVWFYWSGSGFTGLGLVLFLWVWFYKSGTLCNLSIATGPTQRDTQKPDKPAARKFERAILVHLFLESRLSAYFYFWQKMLFIWCFQV